MAAYRKGFSWAWQDAATFGRDAAFAASAGFQGLEPVFGGPLFADGAVKTAALLRRECAAQGLVIPSMRGGRYFWESVSSPDKNVREKGLDYGRRALDTLNELGGSLLLVVPGGKRPDVSYSEHWDMARDFFLRLGEEAASRSLRIGAENVECGFPMSVLEWKAFLEDIAAPGAKAAGMYFDAGNVVWLDYGFPEQWIAVLADHILQVHFKDALRGKRVCPLLHGEVDWVAVMRALCASGYEGWIVAEPSEQLFLASRDACGRILSHYFTTLANDMEEIFQLAPACRPG